VPKKHIPLAICYDFDGTLAPGNMQERDFIPEIGMDKAGFWKSCAGEAKQHDADPIQAYMKLMLERARAKRVQVKRSNFEEYGARLPFFPGVYESNNENWFERINDYGKAGGVNVDHFIVSSGIREMVEGTKIARYFRKIFASSFMYDHHGVAEWPALAVNYTTKTQYIFRINKGSLDVWDDSIINKYVPHNERPVPFTNMVFIGDGLTDIPCFRLVRDQGGHSIAVYAPRKSTGKKQATSLHADGRVNFVAPADYTLSGHLDRIVKGIIDKVAFDTELQNLGVVKK